MNAVNPPKTLNHSEFAIEPKFSLRVAAIMWGSAVVGGAVSTWAMTQVWDTGRIFEGGFVLPLLGLTSVLIGGLTGVVACLSVLKPLD